ncbi:Smr/MutS family protein [Arvimicrobium flavum]|uniref:Smr/MutS family protein n=1 Tax=Arvimicrobium flavum TaxID=3393320 RepID=UPI00237C116B|nr:Smr/MutS family protein [Mesorhizobium shangrilense]
MSARGGRSLSDDDRILWNKVARSAKPLKGTAPLGADPETVPDMQPIVPAAVFSDIAPPPPSKDHKVGRHLDRPTHDKLAKGRLVIEAKVDLHGLTQREAHGLLLSFLHRAHASGVRYVLVVTGKGSTNKGDGVLRRVVPEWLATPAFRSVVSSHDSAARHHGGGGALYVRLRRHAAAGG